MPSDNSSQRRNIVLALIAIAVIGLMVYVVWSRPAPSTGQIACTLEAKQCPDGSFVGRTGSKCEFSACPTGATSTPVSEIPAGWKGVTDTSTQARFAYPVSLPTTYITLVDWPPHITVTTTPFTCAETGSEISSAGKSTIVMIAGHRYCVTKQSEGAAGSVYTQHTYAFTKGDKVVALSFPLRFVQCANYDEPKKSACDAERAAYSPDEMVDAIAQSVRLP